MQIVLAADFFKKERQAYRRWRWALWRELFQNAIDQQASAITIRVAPLTANSYRLSFHDNGPGMSRDILQTVYFAVGASSKGGDDGTIGGMGRARMLTCFSMASWSIRSQDYEVIGSGGSYEVFDRPSVSGCALTIDVDDCSAEWGIEMLHGFLRESRITATVSLNDAMLTLSAGHLGRHIRNLQVGETVFARVYVNKSITTNTVIVRVNGVSMFTTDSDVTGQVVVELLPQISRIALTSNRDGLHYDYSSGLTAFTTELSVNTRSATQGVRQRRTTMVAGGGALRTPRRVKPVPPLTADQRAQAAQMARLTLPSTMPEPLARTAAFTAPSVTVNETVSQGLKTDLAAYLATTFGDIYLFDETEITAMRQSITSYQPENWRLKQLGGKSVRRGATTIKLLMAWKIVLEYAIELSLDLRHGTECAWSVGFVFHDDNLADHRDQDARHIFSLRPVDTSGKRAYAVQDRAALKRLMTLAKHEVTHMAHSWHNEAFSGSREQLDMVFDDTEAFRRIKTALAAMPF